MSITSRTNVASRGSTAYSRITWKPRRATFSVRMERFKTSTLTRWATVAATSNASRLFWSCVSSKAKMMAVKGERVTPPMAAARPMRAHTPGVAPGRTWPTIPPMAAPIIRMGARMPPLVPLPRPAAQMVSLTTKRSASASTPSWPSNSA